MNLFIFYDSIITLKIKGIGDSIIFGNETGQNFQDINYLKEVYINGNRQDKIEYKYNFNQTLNFVELIWDVHTINCDNMFRKCSNIIEINFSHFDSPQITSMESMFYDCSSLISLDLSYLSTSQVESIVSIFHGCKNLEFINLYYLYFRNLARFQDLFFHVPENFVLCINTQLYNEINTEMQAMPCYVLYCEDDWKSKQKKLINNTNECIESCDNSSQYQYEYNGKCYENCSQGLLYDKNSIKMNQCKCEIKECLTCSNSGKELGFCTDCNVGYYPKENDSLNMGEYIKCYAQLEGYCLEDNMYKQ